MRGASLKAVRFLGADLRGCDLGSISLEDTPHFTGATISADQASDLLHSYSIFVR